MKHLVLFLFSSPHPLYLSYLSNKLICDFYIIFVKRQYLKKKLVVAFLFDLSGTFCPVLCIFSIAINYMSLYPSSITGIMSCGD